MLIRRTSLAAAGQSLRARRWRRLLRRHRRALTAVLAGCFVASALRALEPPAAAATAVIVAARDLPGGVRVRTGDLVLRGYPAKAVPDEALPATALGATVGRTLAAPVRRGEPLTDVRLVGPRLVDSLGHGQVATPVRIADPAVPALLRPGDRVDVLAAPADPATGGATTTVAANVRVMAVPQPDPSAGGQSDGALVLLATTARVSVALASAGTADRLSVVLRGGADE